MNALERQAIAEVTGGHGRSLMWCRGVLPHSVPVGTKLYTGESNAPCQFVVTSNEGTSHCSLAEADARDAARYRWLRGNMSYHNVDGQQPLLADVSARLWYHATDDTQHVALDDVIDAAIAKASA